MTTQLCLFASEGKKKILISKYKKNLIDFPDLRR